MGLPIELRLKILELAITTFEGYDNSVRLYYGKRNRSYATFFVLYYSRVRKAFADIGCVSKQLHSEASDVYYKSVQLRLFLLNLGPDAMCYDFSSLCWHHSIEVVAYLRRHRYDVCLDNLQAIYHAISGSSAVTKLEFSFRPQPSARNHKTVTARVQQLEHGQGEGSGDGHRTRAVRRELRRMEIVIEALRGVVEPGQ
jgi:hypothetical protein